MGEHLAGQGIDRRAVGRLTDWGDLLGAPMPCQWRGKPGAIGFTGRGVVLASSSMVGSGSRFALYRDAQLAGTGDSRTVVFRNISEQVVFATTGEAHAFTERFMTNVEQSYEKNRAVRPMRIGPDEILIARCLYLGGAHLPLAVESKYDLLVSADSLQVFGSPASGLATAVHSFAFARNFSVDLGGPGEVVSNGGWFGGGFGLVGGIEGAAIAALLNRLTTRRTISTIITVSTTGAEGFFLNADLTPDQLRLTLSPLFVRLRSIGGPSVAGLDSAAAAARPALIDELERLAALRSSGALTDAEFTAAKAALLAGS